MKKLTQLLSFILILGTTLIAKTYAGEIKTFKTIHLAGIIMDSKTMQPLANADVFDEKDNKIASTNEKGYFFGKLNYPDNGKIGFHFKIEKKGYTAFVQTENWGDVKADNTIYYFGLQQSGTAGNDSFSEMIANKNDITYQSVANGLQTVKNKISFNGKMKTVLNGNENSFFEIDGNYYLINNSGWLKIHSKEDKVSIDNKKDISVTELNKLIKRKDIKRMTPSEDGKSFEIYTK